MARLPEFQEKQYAFAAHIRDPATHPAPAGIEDRRMAIYRELFFNNILKLLSGTFPVLKKIHSREKWRSLVRSFMVTHRAQTPYFLQIPREFLDFLANEYDAGDDDYPFLYELAHYEWAELAVSVSDETNDDLVFDAAGDLLSGIPVKSKLAWNLAYNYPVHRISSDFRPGEPGEHTTFIVIYRKADDDVGFLELNPVTARLLDMIDANDDASGHDLLISLAKEVSYPDPDAFVQHGVEAMLEMRAAEILLGARRSG